MVDGISLYIEPSLRPHVSDSNQLLLWVLGQGYDDETRVRVRVRLVKIGARLDRVGTDLF